MPVSTVVWLANNLAQFFNSVLPVVVLHPHPRLHLELPPPQPLFLPEVAVHTQLLHLHHRHLQETQTPLLMHLPHR
jgi:hypothetical protein